VGSVRKNYYKRRKDDNRQWFREYKSTLACIKCGFPRGFPQQEDPDWIDALEFHHRPGEIKLYNIADMCKGIWARDTLILEIKKCDVLCAICHAIQTAKERRGGENGFANFGALEQPLELWSLVSI
jgi:hypothetical protein